MRNQDQLNQIWDDLKNNKFPAAPGIPKMISDDSAEEAMSIPNHDGTREISYRRKPGQLWEPVPCIGTENSFR